MSSKKPFVHRWFFRKVPHNREYLVKYCDNLNNAFNMFAGNGIGVKILKRIYLQFDIILFNCSLLRILL